MILSFMLALAAPVYLSCTLQEGEHEQAVDLAIDEPNQSVTVTQKTTGRVFRRKSVFTPSEVSIPDEVSVWTIDRTNLKFRRDTTIGDKQFVDHGSCSLVPEPEKRAF